MNDNPQQQIVNSVRQQDYYFREDIIDLEHNNNATMLTRTKVFQLCYSMCHLALWLIYS